VRALFGKFRIAAQQQEAILRVRFSIESSAPELHMVHWETLRDPEISDAPLFMGEQTIASRFLSSGQDWRPIRLRRGPIFTLSWSSPIRRARASTTLRRSTFRKNWHWRRR
jgi:hypothetical protein